MIPDADIYQASRVDLVAFCASRGLSLRREGAQYVLKDYDSLYISAVNPYKWYRFSNAEGGKAIDFCVKFLGMSFHQAVSELLSFSGVPVPIASEWIQKSDRQSEQRCNPRRVIAYLCQKRGIDYQIVKDLIKSDKLYQDSRGNCAFVISDFDGSQIGAELHGTSDQRFKRQQSKQDGFGFVLSSGRVLTLGFFESAIDLISFYQIYHDRIFDYMLVSMGGLKSSVVCNYVDFYPLARVLLFVDNDSRGREFSKR